MNVKIKDEKEKLKIMGYFMDAFDLSAGLTLGNLAVNQGIALPGRILGAAAEQYRVNNFDPVVRLDLNELLATGFLSEKEYPFPEGKGTTEKKNFFFRHKIFSIGLIAFAVDLLLAVLFDMNDFITILGAVSSGIVIYGGVGIFFMKIFKIVIHGGGKLVASAYKPELDYEGREYWKVREYVRQALNLGELQLNEAVLKLSSTRLVQRFPDSVGEIEANAFEYRQKLGL